MFRWEATRGPVIASVFCLTIPALAHAQVKVESVLAYRPAQSDVDCETPTGEEIAKCKLEVERNDGGSGWVLYGPQGQVLRRFLDTDGDRSVDEFRYYKHGLEVYRDLDKNANNKVDESRWLNTAGSRWGVDQNEDDRIDSWKMISAEEASREAILALIARDERRLRAVMLTEDEIRALGIQGEPATKLQQSIQSASNRFKQVVQGSKSLTPRTQWLRFDCSMLMPNLIPAEPGKVKNDLLVYENVMAIVDTAGENGFVTVGEMVKVGDAWKLTQVPTPLEGDRFELTDAGILLQPTVAGGLASAESLSPRLQELIEQLRKLDDAAPQGNASETQISQYNVRRAALLAQLAQEAPSEDERKMWLQQRLEGISAATQMGTFPNGLDELRKAEMELRRSSGDRELLAFTAYQRLLADFNLQLAQAPADERGEVQQRWLKALEAHVQEFASQQPTSEAMLQLAIAHEFNGNTDEAAKWYQQLASSFPDSGPAAKATGALRRLNLKGKPFRLTGRSLTGGAIDTAQLRGKVVAVLFWTTWCKPCTEDLPQIQQLYQQYRNQGFEIVGVNLDSPDAPIQDYLRNFQVAWPQIHEQGALESRPAVEFGVISLPTMFLIGKDGVVVSPAATVEDLKTMVPDLVSK